MIDQRIFTWVWWLPYLSKRDNINLWAKIIVFTGLFLIPCGLLYIGFNSLSLPYLLRITIDGWCAYWWGTEIILMDNRLLQTAREEVITTAIALIQQRREELVTAMTHNRLEALVQRRIPPNDPMATMSAVLDATEQQTPRNPLQEVLAGKYTLRRREEE